MTPLNNNSRCVANLLNYMCQERGKFPVRVYWALESGPLAYRTFGGEERTCVLSEESIESAFGGDYLLTIVTGAAASRMVHAPGSIQTFYVDNDVYRYLDRHGLLDCGLWDYVDQAVLDKALSPGKYNYQWAYSACKPPATLEEIARQERTIRKGGAVMPLLFHDTDLILHRSCDRVLSLNQPDDVKMGVGHLEEIGTDFYPPFSKLSLPEWLELRDGRLLDRKRGLSYRTDLPAVNTCLMYFSDMELAEEWANLFSDFMRDNHAPVSSWLEGEQLLLASDQRPGLMAADRRGLSLGNGVALFVPLTWTGKGFASVPEYPAPPREWHYYRPEYFPPEEYPHTASWNQTIHHTWISKLAIERHAAYGNYVGRFQLELLHSLCLKLGLPWNRLEESLRSFPSLQRFFALYDNGKTIEEQLAEEKKKPVEARLMDDVLIKDLEKPLMPPNRNESKVIAR